MGAVPGPRCGRNLLSRRVFGGGRRGERQYQTGLDTVSDPNTGCVLDGGSN
jgi:hypothetical protein